jgi:predicted PurR-regulated permease PerM
VASEEKTQVWGLFALWSVFAITAGLIVFPFIRHLLLAVVFTIIFWPLYSWASDRTGWPRATALMLVLMLVLGVLIPGAVGAFFLLQNIPDDVAGAVQALDFSELESFIERLTGTELNLSEWFEGLVELLQDYIVGIAPRILVSAADATIGLFILFFTLYYLFYQGPDLLLKLRNTTPMHKRRFDSLMHRMRDITRGVLYGQLLTGLIEGVLLGVVFWILGVPFPVLWGALVVIFSLVPLLGPITIWVPASLWLLFTGQVWQGVVLVVFGAAVISQIDNVFRPYIMSRYTEVHPVIVLVGVLGGLHLLGFAGFFVGPLVLAILLVLTEFLREELA